MRIIGVITGDIVNSTRCSPEDRQAMIQSLGQIVKNLSGKYKIRTEFYRGDSLQVLVENPIDTMMVAILLRAAFKGSALQNRKSELWDIRLSVSVGSWEHETESFNTTDGEAFRISGRKLDEMKKDRLAFNSSWKNIDEELSVATSFLDFVMTNWNRIRAKRTYEMLYRGCDIKELSKQEGTTPQNISKSLKEAGYLQITKYLERFNQMIYNVI